MTTTPGSEFIVGVEEGSSSFEQLRVRFKEVDPTQRDDLFWEFVADLARQEIVEEVVIIPAPRRFGRAGGGAGRAVALEGKSEGRVRIANRVTASLYPDRIAQGQ
jgi:hypothetical protein